MKLEFKYLFDFGPFYNHTYAECLPSVESTILHFQSFCDVYFSVESVLNDAYTTNDNNLWIVLGHKKGEFKKSLNSNEYNEIHKFFQSLKDYYQLLLIACNNRHGIWLNDYLPEQYKSKKKARKKSA